MSFITTNHHNEGDTDDDDENYDCIQYNDENHDYALQKTMTVMMTKAIATLMTSTTS